MGRLKAAHVMITPMSNRIPAINMVVFLPYFLHASAPVFSRAECTYSCNVTACCIHGTFLRQISVPDAKVVRQTDPGMALQADC